MEMDFNKSECITYVTRWSYYEFHNLCNGSVKTISWGFGEWIGAATVALFLAGVLIFLAFITGLDYKIIRSFNKKR